MAKKELRYKPSPKSIGLDTCILQAARLIDLASLNAEKQGDTAGMLAAAEAWSELAGTMRSMLAGEEEDEEEDPESMGDRTIAGTVGFGATVKEMRENNERIKNLPDHHD